ncbi:MAG TPA: endonuclease III [Cyanobacteria bacterium UBA8530]|nr:endonuclease III [Cyanobacteria bacterium UBA8530]
MKSKKPLLTSRILAILEATYPEAKTTLEWKTPFQLLVATVLSAQSTDKAVNKATKKLFEDHPDPESFAKLSPEELKSYIKTVGLSSAKARHLVEADRMILENFEGQVPRTLEELMSLPGVGRKTGNVVLSNAFGIPAIAVDTHVYRVSHRLGLTSSKSFLGTEKELMEAIPKEKWSQAHHWLIHHGRAICKSKPLCSICPLNEICPRVGVRRETRGGG